MSFSSILDYFPPILPKSRVRTTETYTFRVIEHDDGSTTTDYVYELDKAPITTVETVTGIVDGRSVTFTKGTDYTVVDTTGDGDPDAVDFSTDGRDPDANTPFEVTYTAQSLLNRYVTAHDTVAASVETDIDAAIDSHQVDDASGKDLERIGALFGELGERRGRSDAEYRALLKSIVQSFNGQGTKPGMKFAIATGIGTDTSNIVINEDYQQVGYEIRIENVDTTFLSGVINDMADLADPSGVDLLSPPVIVLTGESIEIGDTGSSMVSSSVGLGGQTLTMDGSSALGYQRASTTVVQAAPTMGTSSTSTTAAGVVETSTGSPTNATNF